MIKKVLIGYILCFLTIAVSAQSAKERWVDSVFAALELKDKIGQLLMVPVNSYGESEINRLESQIKSYNLGGIVYTTGSPVRQAHLTNHLQRLPHVPLWVAMNAEEGLGSTLDSTYQFAPPLMLGALKADSLVYFLGQEIGRQLKEIGVHISFSPTVNLTNSFENEENWLSTFGANKYRVAEKVMAFQKGMQQQQIMSAAKHYPESDMYIQGFNKGVPQFKSQVDPDKYIPLQKFIESGGTGVVNAYQQGIIMPSRKNRFTAKKALASAAAPMLYSAEYLKQQLKFSGLVFSYIPDIKEVNRKFKAGDSEVYAFKAGNDILLFPENIPATIRKMRKALKKDAALQNHLNESVKKILAMKYDQGLYKIPFINTENLIARLNTPSALLLKETLLEQCVTVIKDDVHTLPIKQLENKTFASLTIGESKENTCTHFLEKYAPFTHYAIRLAEDTIGLVKKLKQYDVVIAVVHPFAKELGGVYPSVLKTLQKNTSLIVVSVGSLSQLSLIDQLPTLIETYTDQSVTLRFIPQLIFGASKVSSALPVTINENLKEGQGIETSLLGRLGYSTPEAVGINSKELEQISKIARQAIDEKATPGCQIVVARRGKIIYEKSLGWQTYDNAVPVNDQSIYDIASVTKVVATLQATMFLYERGELDIYKKASVYLPELAGTNKHDLIVKDILTHQAGLVPFVPFWTQTIKNSDFLPQYYSREKSDAYPLQIAPHLFGVASLRDSLWQWSIQSKLREKPPRTPYSYVYSDIGLYILHHINDKLLNQPQEDFLQQNLYEPLGAYTMGYLPLLRFEENRIVPTEDDKLFRKELLRGTVHDEGAAMLGGVAGHAGVFSNAIDLTKLGQMVLQKGYYGGQQFYKPETVSLFTTKQFETSRRGLGWDKPVQSEWNSPTSLLASPLTYGHTGFTGTCIWIDPEFELVYVFLSNRVHPDRSNNKLSGLNIRSRIQDAIYQSIFSYGQYGNRYSPIERYIQTSINNKP